MSRIPVIGLCEVAQFMTLTGEHLQPPDRRPDGRCLASAFQAAWHKCRPLGLGTLDSVFRLGDRMDDESKNTADGDLHGSGAEEPFDPFHGVFLSLASENPCPKNFAY